MREKFQDVCVCICVRYPLVKFTWLGVGGIFHPGSGESGKRMSRNEMSSYGQCLGSYRCGHVGLW